MEQRFLIASVAGEDGQPLYYACCAKECGFPVAIARLLVPEEPAALRHGARGVCLNWTLSTPHEQRYCKDPCDRFVRVDHYNRSDPKRGHSIAHKRRQPGR